MKYTFCFSNKVAFQPPPAGAPSHIFDFGVEAERLGVLDVESPFVRSSCNEGYKMSPTYSARGARVRTRALTPPRP